MRVGPDQPIGGTQEAPFCIDMAGPAKLPGRSNSGQQNRMPWNERDCPSMSALVDVEGYFHARSCHISTFMWYVCATSDRFAREA
jgi:hypothetical protein